MCKRFHVVQIWVVLVFAINWIGLKIAVGAEESRIAEWVTLLPDHESGWYHHPDLSPDDRYTAMSIGERDFDRNTIWIHDSDTGKLTQLTTPESKMIWGDVMVRWSPNGELLGFASDRGGESHLYTISADGSSLQKITSKPLPFSAWDCRFSFSPDGRKILYSDGEDGETNLYTFDLVDKRIEQITNFSGRVISAPDWSSDGKFIVYQLDEKFYIWDLERQVESLVDTDRTGSFPTWSPDGQWIGFQRREYSYWRTYLVSRSGGPAIMVGPGDTYHSQVPSWSSDGNHIVYHGGKREVLPVVVRSLADGSEQVLTDSLNHVGWFWGSWSPNSQLLTFMNTDFQNGIQVTELMMGDIDTGTIVTIDRVYPQPSSALRQMPVWFANSERFLMVKGDSTNSEIVAVDIGDLTSQPLTTVQGIKCEAVLSPDEELIAFLVKSGKEMDIWLFDRVTEEEMQLTFNEREKAQLRFSPDGEQIAFVQNNPPTKNDIMVVSVDGGAPRQISKDTEWELDPDWIDNDYISYTMHPAGSTRVFAHGSLEDEPTRDVISSPGAHLVMPYWSLDRNHLYYQAGWPQGPFMLRNIKTGEKEELISVVRQPILSRDQSRVAYLDPRVRSLQFLWRENVEHIVRTTKLP